MFNFNRILKLSVLTLIFPDHLRQLTSFPFSHLSSDSTVFSVVLKIKRWPTLLLIAPCASFAIALYILSN